ncbi:hypothetical protein [Nocardia otitidiscaviarum]|uniref:hypothetical protein n=1 Tax=Nocardia otitidiscaviarum TaxID=1823 RepID=UPI0024571379|nr:hypothetical protein [Nocardia otitidiscaviarum]
MTTRRRDAAREAAWEAEKNRLEFVQDILADMLDAALAVKDRKGHLHCEAENAKIRHWTTVRESVRADRNTAADHLYDLRYGRAFVETVRADRSRSHTQQKPPTEQRRDTRRSR